MNHATIDSTISLRVPPGVFIPDRIRQLPRDRRGFPIPWFVPAEARNEATGEADFRFVDARRIAEATVKKICHVCGQRLGRHMAFAIGPMCAINRLSSEPPSHRDCAIFSAQVCPFLTRPNMKRNPEGIDHELQAVIGPGTMLARNPGVTLVYVTRGFDAVRDKAGLLFWLGDPTEVIWFAEGREATRAEVDASVAGGLPLLRDEATRQGPAAIAELDKLIERASPLWPTK